jgi:hypothetical protein
MNSNNMLSGLDKVDWDNYPIPNLNNQNNITTNYSNNNMINTNYNHTNFNH